MIESQEFAITVTSGRLHAQRWGSPSAPLLLGLPGLSGNIKSFSFLGERIGDESLQLVALDLRGRGRSETTPPGTYGWANHAQDAFDAADALGFRRCSLIGQSMGGSVAMKAAELDGPRLRAVVLVDVAGRVDRGIGAVIDDSMKRLERVYPSAERYVDDVRSQGLIEPWNECWENVFRYDLHEEDGRFRSRTSPEAVAEDRAYTATEDPYRRWTHLTMPTLLLRATRELKVGSGFIVPVDDRDRFAREIAGVTVIEVDANHLTINTHPEVPPAVREFLRLRAAQRR